MKKLIFTFFFVLCWQNMHSQSPIAQIEDSVSYYYDGHMVYLTKCVLTNMSPDTLVMWISDSINQKNDDIGRINEYFFYVKDGGVTSLSQLIYDSNVSSIEVEIGTTFLKEMLPNTSFTIFFCDTSNHNNNFYLEYISRHIISVQKKSLMNKWYNYPSCPTWQLLIYKKDYILLDNL